MKNRDFVVDSLQKEIHDQVQEIKLIDTGYDSTNIVWDIKTKHNGEIILKISSQITDTSKSLFWLGQELLFGSDPSKSLNYQNELSKFLNSYGIVPVPRIIQYDASLNNAFGGPYLVVEKMLGSSLPQGSEIEIKFMSDAALMEQLGKQIASLHLKTFPRIGNVSGSLQVKPMDFKDRLITTLRELASHPLAQDNDEVQTLLPNIIKQAQEMDIPKTIATIMLDLWPSQFLSDNKKITALIDIESYVHGPIELELTVLELWVENIEAFKKGYTAVNPNFPNLDQTRGIYRYLLYLMYSCPQQGLNNLLHAPAKFCYQQPAIKP